MNCNHLEAIALLQKLAFALPEKYYDKVEVAVLPPFTDIRTVQTMIDGDQLLMVHGAQDLSPHDSGAYTGDVSGRDARQARAARTWSSGTRSAGRSTARTTRLVNSKVHAAIRHGIVPILCVGEGLEVREAGDHVAALHPAAHRGAGRGDRRAGADPRDRLRAGVGDRHRPGGQRRRRPGGVRRDAAGAWPTTYGEAVAAGCGMLYGGSVKAKNVAEIVAEADVDGALVGGASLDADEFAQLCAITAGGPLP